MKIRIISVSRTYQTQESTGFPLLWRRYERLQLCPSAICCQFSKAFTNTSIFVRLKSIVASRLHYEGLYLCLLIVLYSSNSNDSVLSHQEKGVAYILQREAGIFHSD